VNASPKPHCQEIAQIPETPPKKPCKQQEGTSSNAEAGPSPQLPLKRSLTEEAGPRDSNCPGMPRRVILCSGTPSRTPACTKSTSHVAAGKLTHRKEEGEKKKRGEKPHHVPQLKGRSKHWDTLLTQRYTLAYIPLTKINILASVLTFTSSFSSHLSHYNHCIYSSLPSIAPCHVHTLPSASTSFLSCSRSPAAFYLSAVDSYLHSATGSSLDLYLTLHPSTLSFIHLSSFIF